MKTGNSFRAKGMAADPETTARKGAKLAPMKKSGKEKHFIYSEVNTVDDELDDEIFDRKESILDYFDDEEEDF